jgi:hypothetical protein
LSANEARITISEKEKAILVQGVIDSALKIMQRIISTKSPKKCARDSSKPHAQSKTNITRGTIFFNILTNNQRLPARPRDFRINLAEEEKDLADSELSDILSSIVRQHFLERKREKLSFPRGRPVSDIKKSGIARGRRGAKSYYTSQIKQVVDEILKDSKSRESIDNAILKSEIFYRFLKYSFEVSLYQMKEDERAFLNTMKAPINQYGLPYKKLEELDSSYIFVKDLTPDEIKRQAKGLAIVTVKKFQEDGKNILYTVAGLFSLLNVYGLEKGEKESKVV